MTITKFTAGALGLGAAVFVLLLAGVASGALTDDPPAVNPYATGSTTTAAAATDSTPDTTAPGAAPGAISIADFSFGDPIATAVGAAVTVTNDDGATHTWTATDGSFDSGSIGPGGSFSHTFESPGEFGFFCSIHPSMTGTITITG